MYGSPPYVFMLKTNAFVQARMGSTRLPGKVLINIHGKPMLHHVIRRLNVSTYIDDIIVVTSGESQDDYIETYCDEHGVKIFRGDENDVLSRYYNASELYVSEYVLRVTADCPVIDPYLINNLINIHISNKYDYSNIDTIETYPRGLDAEIFSKKILDEIHVFAKKQYEREHVTPYILSLIHI